MFKAWVCIILYTANGGGNMTAPETVILADIATRESCERLGKRAVVNASNHEYVHATYSCTEIYHTPE